jgi:hypothetical protein
MDTIPNPVTLAAQLTIVEGDSYILSYPHIRSWFAEHSTFTERDVVCGAHMVYGWMPTIIDLDLADGRLTLAAAAVLMTKARRDGHLDPEEIDSLASLMNNSLVGASKLLHFAAPDAFAIWDSRIYAFLNGKRPHHYQVRDVKAYTAYLDKLTYWSKSPGIDVFRETVNRKIGYAVSTMRAMELVMFQHSGAVGV